MVRAMSASFLRFTTWMYFGKSITRSSVHQQTTWPASRRRSSLHSCSGRTPHTLRCLVPQSCGLYTIYLLFGNLSKYIRCQPDSGATKHVAYIPPLPDLLQDELKSFHQKWDTQHKDILTHCRHELMHHVWAFLLDKDFQHAYKYGIVVQGQDWIEQCVYPRIVTYSTDYPKKFVLNFSL